MIWNLDASPVRRIGTEARIPQFGELVPADPIGRHGDREHFDEKARFRNQLTALIL